MDTAQLVIRCQSGDREALGCLYNLYAPSMMRVIVAYVRNRDVAHDILHDGFIIAFSAIDGLKKPARFESWLTTIMRNLALQYLREAADRMAVPTAEAPGDGPYEDDAAGADLSWDELNGIIDRLPEGYGKVFRLAVFDGLSHKEIGAKLGIAPHSSSSQLSHAKAMLRRLISEYRIANGVAGILAVVLSVCIVWQGINRRPSAGDDGPTGGGTERNVPGTTLTVVCPKDALAEETIASSLKTALAMELAENENAAEAALPEDTVLSVPVTGEAADTVPDVPKPPTTGVLNLSADNDKPARPHANANRMSLVLAYSGNAGHDSYSRYRLPAGADPELPNGVPEETDVTERARHYMPLTIGLTLNRSLTDRWSVGTGIRYTFLRSGFVRESDMESVETDQRIHYVGVPLKFSYRISRVAGLSLYGHGGMALDIPVRGTQTIVTRANDGDRPASVRRPVSAPLQWSVEGGLGLLYHVTPSLSICAEPSFRYYFDAGPAVRTLRQDKPLELAVPIGIRFEW